LKGHKDNDFFESFFEGIRRLLQPFKARIPANNKYFGRMYPRLFNSFIKEFYYEFDKRLKQALFVLYSNQSRGALAKWGLP
jgi:hypothetical protein